MTDCYHGIKLGPRPLSEEEIMRRTDKFVEQLTKKLQEKNMTVRAKFQVAEITHNHWNANSTKIVLRPQYDQNIPEDVRFNKATPSGEFWMQVDNPAAAAALELGKFYYIDLTPVEPTA